jgi:hypothetical protein
VRLFENARANFQLHVSAMPMRLPRAAGRMFAALVLWTALGSLAWASDWEDGYAAYMNGDYDAAFKFFMSAADQGNAQAMNMLSIMYSNGEGVTPNFSEASLWSERANAQRSSDSIESSQGTNEAGSNK